MISHPMRGGNLGQRTTSVLVILMLSLGPLALIGGTMDTGTNRGPGPFQTSEVWSDSFDDLSKVYVPESGLVGVEVTGGEVRLKPG
jgi:hypothetical protein